MSTREKHDRARARRLAARAVRADEFFVLIPQEARYAELLPVAVRASLRWQAARCGDARRDLVGAARELVLLGMPVADLAGVLDVSQAQLRRWLGQSSSRTSSDSDSRSEANDRRWRDDGS